MKPAPQQSKKETEVLYILADKLKQEWQRSLPIYDKTNFFTTYDLGATAALINSGYELMAVDKKSPNKALFVFRREGRIEETIDDYWADRLKVKARRYFDSLKAVKNRLYSSK